MSAAPQWIVIFGDETWQVARVDPKDIQTSEPRPLDRGHLTDAADGIVQVLEEWGYGGGPVLLALGSSWCVHATVGVPTPRHARNRQAMAYLFEPHLPWAAEEIVVDYELDATKALMVAAPLQPLADAVNRLEGSGVRIESVAPMARLALESHLSQHPKLADRYALLWGHDETVELWLIDGDHPVNWQWLAQEPRAVTAAVRQLGLSCDSQLRIVGRSVPPQIQEELAAVPGIDWHELDAIDGDGFLEAGSQTAAAVLTGQRNAAIELRRDALAAGDPQRAVRRHVTALSAAMIFLLAAVGTALLVKSQQYESRRETISQQQTALFRRLFPERRVPVGVRSRLESELARLEGMRGKRTDMPESVPSLVVLERLLKALPDHLRFRLLEVRIENGRLYLVGHVRTHGDSDRIADALRSIGLEVSPPTTHRLRQQGVEFRLSARLADPAEAGGKSAT